MRTADKDVDQKEILQILSKQNMINSKDVEI